VTCTRRSKARRAIWTLNADRAAVHRPNHRFNPVRPHEGVTAQRLRWSKSEGDTEPQRYRPHRDGAGRVQAGQLVPGIALSPDKMLLARNFPADAPGAGWVSTSRFPSTRASGATAKTRDAVETSQIRSASQPRAVHAQTPPATASRQLEAMGARAGSHAHDKMTTRPARDTVREVLVDAARPKVALASSATCSGSPSLCCNARSNTGATWTRSLATG
jgi:hypothetical protein